MSVLMPGDLAALRAMAGDVARIAHDADPASVRKTLDATRERTVELAFALTAMGSACRQMAVVLAELSDSLKTETEETA